MTTSRRASGAGARPEVLSEISISGGPDIRTVTGRMTACCRSTMETVPCGSTPTVTTDTTTSANTREFLFVRSFVVRTFVRFFWGDKYACFTVEFYHFKNDCIPRHLV